MLDEKDKIILEYLMSDCRITTTKLAKFTKLSQPSVVYRIQKLEKENYITKYDVLINSNHFKKSKMYFIFLSIPNKKKNIFENIVKKDERLMTVVKHISKYNYSITAILTQKEINNLIVTLDKYNFNYFVEKGEKNKHFPTSAFNIDIKETKKKEEYKYLDLDEKDGLILNRLQNGGAKNSILELAKHTNLPIDLTLYRFKKMQKAGYFELNIAQANLIKFHLQYDIITFKVKNMEEKEIFRMFKKNKKAIFVSNLGNGKYIATIVSKNFRDYKNTLKELYNQLDYNLISLNEFMIDEIIKLNQTDFKRIINNENT